MAKRRGVWKKGHAPQERQHIKVALDTTYVLGRGVKIATAFGCSRRRYTGRVTRVRRALERQPLAVLGGESIPEAQYRQQVSRT